MENSEVCGERHDPQRVYRKVDILKQLAIRGFLSVVLAPTIGSSQAVKDSKVIVYCPESDQVLTLTKGQMEEFTGCPVLPDRFSIDNNFPEPEDEVY